MNTKLERFLAMQGITKEFEAELQRRYIPESLEEFAERKGNKLDAFYTAFGWEVSQLGGKYWMEQKQLFTHLFNDL